jgi:radical SAM protein with 4Fe4S-binding SPASM domain
MAIILRKLKTGLDLYRKQGLKAVMIFASHRYKYPFLQVLVRVAPGWTPLKHPHVVQIEVSSKCNLRCPSCSLTRETTPARNMALEELRSLVEKLPFRPQSVSLNGIGEALVNPAFFEIVDLLRERSISCSFYTNGTLLNERVRGEILRRENISFIGISCDGASKEVFEELRFGAKLESWRANVEAFVAGAAKRRPSPLQITMSTVLSRRNQHEIFDIVKLAADLGFKLIQISDIVENDEVTAAMALTPEENAALDRSGIVAYAASLGVSAAFSSESKKPRPHLNCFQPWEYVQISAEGDVLPCCAILGSNKTKIMGNLHQEDFAAIWEGPAFRDFRATAARGTNPVCNECPYY